MSKLPLRINSLSSGDLNGDGKIDGVAAGRTVKNNLEQGAFAVFSDTDLLWKQLKTSENCQYRYAEVADITGDGHPELILGGRMDHGNTLIAMLDIWKVNKTDAELLSRYRFTGAGSTRLRLVASKPGSSGHLIIGGRIQTIQKDQLKWKGFLQQVTFISGTLFPSSEPIVLEKDFETQVRTMDIIGNTLIAGGFTENKRKVSSGLITFYKIR